MTNMFLKYIHKNIALTCDEVNDVIFLCFAACSSFFFFRAIEDCFAFCFCCCFSSIILKYLDFLVINKHVLVYEKF